MKSETKALIALFTIPVFWGITFPLTHRIVMDYSPSLFILWRFIIASLIVIPYFVYDVFIKRQWNKTDFIYGLILGIVNSGIFIFQAASLQTIGSAQSAFILGLCVVFVPFLGILSGFGYPKKIDVIAAFVCCIGMYFITGIHLAGYHLGDMLAVGSALCTAINILIMQRASLVCKRLLVVVFYQIIFTSLIPLFILKGHISLPHNLLFWSGVFYCAVFATVIPLVIRLKFQRFVSSTKVAIILNLEAVTATGCAWIFGEKVTNYVLLGGAFILISSVLSDLVKYWRIAVLKN